MDHENRTAEHPTNFLRDIVAEDLRTGRQQRVVTRFPPEPNGYLHIGHAKSICLNFGLALEFGGVCHLRMDDTNPLKEDPEYVENIKRDVRWLGFEWGANEFAASDYFPQLYTWALQLVDAGTAYVDHLTEDEIREYRGSVTEPGRASPFRDRSVAENRRLLEAMHAGDVPDGTCVLRAKGDLHNPNMKMRDPLIYRVRRVEHHAAGSWNIYPMYDYAHCLSDYIEGITHSLCTLEFENNRELYDWFIEILNLPRPRPRQYEFARLNLAHTMMSKRRLLTIVQQGTVSGWDDPRMPTLAGLRRRGVTPEALRLFAERIGVARADNLVEQAVLDAAIRDDLDAKAPRRLAVIHPLKVTITGDVPATVLARDWPEATGREGTREIRMGSEIWVDRDDFAADPPKGWRRLAPGAEVRLRYADVVIRCDAVTDDGLRCSVVDRPAAEVKGIVHWLPIDAPTAKIRHYEHLFDVERPDQHEDWQALINPQSLVELDARVEPALLTARPEERFQLERTGFYYVDPTDSRPGAPVLHRILSLKASFGRKPDAQKSAPKAEPTRQATERAAYTPEVAAWVARGVTGEDADVLVADPDASAWMDGVVAAGAPAGAAAVWVAQELRRAKGERAWSELPFDAAKLAALVGMVGSTVTTAVARQILERMVRDGVDPVAYAADHGLQTVSDDGALLSEIDAVITANADKVAQYRSGKTSLLGMFVGQVMKRTQGRADAVRVSALLTERLAG